MYRLFWVAMVLSAALLSGCKTMANETPIPALLAQTDSQIITQLETVISKAMDGRKIALAPDSLMDKSYIAINPPSVGRRNGMIIDGRSMERPDHFDLMMAGRTCYLVHRQTGEKYKLKNMPCVAAS